MIIEKHYVPADVSSVVQLYGIAELDPNTELIEDMSE
jgi:hypothetical protein